LTRTVAAGRISTVSPLRRCGDLALGMEFS